MEYAPVAPHRTDCPSKEDWSAFYTGQAPEEVVLRLAAHLERCPTCCSKLQALEGQADPLVKDLRRSLEDPYGHEPACHEAICRVRILLSQSSVARGVMPGPLRALGPYRLLRKIGEGSMGIVYQARHERTHQIVALKLLCGRRSSTPVAAARFRREIEAVSRLDHAHIIRATDAGEDDGFLYLVMEYAEGIDLAHLLQVRQVPVADACELVRQAALGLQHAHINGLVHRDVKPSNLFLSTRGQVKVLDLGLAIPTAGELQGEALTSSGQVLGTFDYMAPEQCRDSHEVNARTDVYSLGCTLYHLLTGHVPFAGSRYQTPQSKLWAHAYDAPPSLLTERPAIGPELAALVERLLAKDPAVRCATAAEVAATLAPFAAAADLQALLAGIEPKAFEPGNHAKIDELPVRFPHPRVRFATLSRMVLLVAAVLLLSGLVLSAVQKLTRHSPSKSLPGNPSEQQAAPREDGPGVAPPVAKRPAVYPTALFVFEERGAGARELGQKVTDLLFAKLTDKPGISLVDREDLRKTLAEAELNLSGAVKAAEANKVGQLTGAKLLVTGSVVQVDKKLVLVAKIIGTETSKVVGASVDGKASDDLDALVGRLADRIAETIGKKSEELVAVAVVKGDRLAALKRQLNKSKRPAVMIRVTERHLGAATIDPAAQTELMLFCKETGFEVIDAEEGLRSNADVLITGEGISTFASRHGNLVTVKARLEVKAVDRKTDKVLAVDRQTALVVGLTEQLAGKAALQEAAAAIAERMLPKLVK